MKQANFLSLNWKDLVKGLITAVITAILTGLVQALESGTALPTLPQIKLIVISGITAGLAYLAKNLLTNSNDQFATKEQKPKPEADGPGNIPPGQGPGGK